MPHRHATVLLVLLLPALAAVGQDDALPVRDAPPPPPASDERPPIVDRNSIEIVRDIVYAEIERAEGEPVRLALDAAFPRHSDEKPLPVAVYVHGGGWSGGSRQAGDVFLPMLARGGYLAVSISYRLTGEDTWPAQLHDCKAAIRFLRANADELGIDAERIGVWGHSAGGHLSSMLGTCGDVEDLEGDVGDGGVTSRVACVAALSGPADLTTFVRPRRRGGDVMRDLLGSDDPEELARLAREASPVTWIDADDPPFLIVHGTDDRLVPSSQAQSLHDALVAAGVKSELVLLEGEGHAITNRDAYRRVAAFFDAHLGGNAVRAMNNDQ